MQTSIAIAMTAAFALIAACAHDAPINTLHASIRQLGKDVSKVIASTNNPDSASDPTSFRARIHEEVVPLRERLEKLRDRTNTEVDKDDANGKDASAKEEDKRATMLAELDQMESQLNSVDVPETGTPP